MILSVLHPDLQRCTCKQGLGHMGRNRAIAGGLALLPAVPGFPREGHCALMPVKVLRRWLDQLIDSEG